MAVRSAPKRSTRSKTSSSSAPAKLPPNKNGNETDNSLTDLSDDEEPISVAASVQSSDDRDEDEESESSDEDIPEDDDDEEFAPTKKAKQAANKARKSNGATPRRTPKKTINGGQPSSASRAGRSTGPRAKAPARARAGTVKARGAGSKDELPINEDNELFNAVKDPNTALQSTAEDWVVSFQDKEGQALAQLINFIIRTCGCNGSVDENQVVDIDNIVDNLEELQESFKRQPIPSYPIVSKCKTFKSFRRSLSEFLHRLISSAYDAEVLTADGFMESFQAWVSAMSSSSLRSFRHTATVIALWTISSINEISAQAAKDLSTATKQRDAEKKKARTDKSRLKELERKVDEALSLKAKLDEYVDEFINSVFVHRYRDYDAGIRTECVEELGSWMKKHSTQYLQGSYFRYIGWVLSDVDASVRMAAIRAMTGLYTRENFVGSIRHFTEMFKGRLVQMATGDVDLSVRIATISVLVVIDKHDMLDEEQRDSLATHIFDVESKVRISVANFLASILEDEVQENIDSLDSRGSSASKKKGKRDEEQDREVAKLRLKCLASLLVRYGSRLDNMDEESVESNGSTSAAARKQAEDLSTLLGSSREGRVGMAVEALWQAVDSIQEWQPLIDLLLLDHSAKTATNKRGKGNNAEATTNLAPEAYRLEADEEAVLVEALVAILRKTYEHADLVKDDDDTSKEDMTRAMMPALPKLLAKYRTDAPRISDLLLIPQVMDLEMYTEMRETAAYEALWDDISAQIQRHIEPQLLKHAVDALRKMMSTSSLSNINTTKVQVLQEALISALRETAKERDVETAGFSEDEVHLLGANMLRLNILSQVCDMSEAMEEDERGQATSGWEIVIGLGGRGRLGYREEEKMVQDAIQVLTLHIMWKTRLSISHDGTSQASAFEALFAKRTTLLKLLNEYIAASQSNACAGVQKVAFEKLLTVHMMYAALPTATEKAADVVSEDANVRGSLRFPAALRLTCEEEVQYRCAGFIQAEIDRYIEKCQIQELESKAAEEASSSEEEEEAASEDDQDEDGECTPRASKSKKRKAKKTKQVSKPKDDAAEAERPTHSRLEAEHAFCSTISIFVSAIRVGIIDARHSTAVLVQFGRLGGIYDSCCKVLIEVLKEEAIFGGYNRAVIIENAIWDALKDSFELFCDTGFEAAETRFVSLSRQIANVLVVRGGGFTAIKTIDPRCLVSIHSRGSEYVAQKVAAADRSGNKALRAKLPCLYKGLANMLMVASPTYAVKIKAAMDRAYRAAEVEIPPAAKAWEPQRSYERRLLKIAAKSALFVKSGPTPGSGRKRAGSFNMDSGGELSEEDEDEEMRDGSPTPQNKRGAAEEEQSEGAASPERTKRRKV